MSIVTDPKELSTMTTPLDVCLAEKIIENLQDKEDCTNEIVEMVLSAQIAQLKKLALIFVSLENYRMEKIVEITTSKVRFQRYNSTFLVFSWIKQKFLNLKKISEVEAIYESVFVSRFRDVDPSIRAMCVQFLCDWALCSKTLCKKDYLKYIGYSLNDKNDSVRRKALKSVFKISKILKKKEKGEIVLFIEKYKSRLLEIALKDININIQKEACRTILYIYLKNNEVFTRTDIIEVLLCDFESTNLKSLIFQKLCPEGIWDLDDIHQLLYESNSKVFKHMKLSSEDTTAFIFNIINFIKDKSNCCDNNSLCYLDILKELKISVDPILFIDLLEIIKDNSLNIKKVLICLSSVTSYLEYPASTFNLLDYTKKLIKNEENFFIEEFAQLLKLLETEFSLQVTQMVDDLKSKYPAIFIKMFDISDDINDWSIPIVKCYGALWQIMKENYIWVNALEFKPIQEDLHTITSKSHQELWVSESNKENTNNYGMVNTTNNQNKIEINDSTRIESTSNNDFLEMKENLRYNASNEVDVSKKAGSINKANVVPLNDTKASANEYLELVDFVVFLIKKIPIDFSVPIDYNPSDTLSCSRLLFEKLANFITANFCFNDEYSCLFLYKLISLGHFTEFSKTLFTYCSEENLDLFISQSKSIKPLLTGYFEHLYENKTKILQALSKRMALKAFKTENDRYVFFNLKKLISRIDLIDTVLINFVTCLNVSECIVLENLLNKSKMKTLLLRKSRKTKNVEEVENITIF